MLPSRRLGRLAQLLVLSQRPRRFLSTERVARHVLLPSRRLGRLAQLLVLSQRPRRFLSTERVARHVLLPSRRLGRLVQLLALSQRPGAFSLPSVWCGMCYCQAAARGVSCSYSP